MTKRILSVLLAVVMMVGMLTVFASAEEAEVAPQICVGLPGENSKGDYKLEWAIVKLGETPKYYLTNDKGHVLTAGADAENYNVKVEYPEAGKAAVYLKNAYLNNNQVTVLFFGRVGYTNMADITGYPMTLVVEADSKIEAPHRDAELSYVGYACIGAGNSDTITITGPGKLTAVAQSNHVISFGGKDLTIKDANLSLTSEMPLSWGTRHAIFGSGNLTIDNSTIEMTASAGVGIMLSNSHSGVAGDPRNITIKNGSKITATNLNTNHGTLSCKGELTIDSSAVELTSKAKSFTPKPTLIGVGALGGTKPSNAKPYNEKKASSYTYFKCGTDIEVVTEPVTEATQATTPVTEATTPATEATKPATQATKPATQASTPATQATKPAGTQATTPANTTGTNDGEDEGGSNVILFVVLGILVAAAVAGAVIFVVLKKKNDDEVEEGEEAEETEADEPAETEE